MDLNEKVKIIEEKEEKLEKEEAKRKRKKLIKIIIKVIYYLAIVVLIYMGYRYLKVNYLDPYDKFKNSVNENINGIKNYDYKSLIDELFN